MEKPLLDRATFLGIICHTPLVAIDLIVRDAAGRVLLGMRRNEPAKGYWFVPGGRILKGETLDEAFARIGRKELGADIRRADATYLGVYEHIYDVNVDNADFGTHYVVQGYVLTLPGFDAAVFAGQHEESGWFTVEELMADERVHENTRAYFR